MKVRVVVLWMCLGVLAAFGLYTVKYRVQALKGEVARAETRLREEKTSLHVLAAEWTYLNRPERLSALAAKYLDIKPVRGTQIADFSTLPVSGATLLSDAKTRAPLAKGVTLASGAVHVQ